MHLKIRNLQLYLARIERMQWSGVPYIQLSRYMSSIFSNYWSVERDGGVGDFL